MLLIQLLQNGKFVFILFMNCILQNRLKPEHKKNCGVENTLFLAWGHENFPVWASASLKELRNGDILKHLKAWLHAIG